MTVKELYEKIHGNYQNALSMMMMDDFIKRMLTKFVQSNPASNLFKAYEDNDYQAVFAAAHSLKGVTGNLALTSLYDKVVPIVEKTRNASPNSMIDVDKEMNDFKAEYQFVIEIINKFLNK